jgi:hypothetical protein
MIDDARVFSLGKGISLQNLGPKEGAVVLMIDSGQLYTCNDTTTTFLAAVDGQRTFAQIIDELHNLFEVSAGELRADMGALARQLIEDRIIV